MLDPNPGVEAVFEHFPQLTAVQRAQFAALYGHYAEWNEKVNVISRKDMPHFYLHHVLHSMAIAKLLPFAPGTTILDVGTGGGFPGIPLAIAFPDCHFTLVDSVNKKIAVVNDVAARLNLTNVTALWGRMEQVNGTFDVALSRAVAPLSTLAGWLGGKVHQSNYDVRGLICLKGGNLTDEIVQSGLKPQIFELSSTFSDPYFEEKRVLWVREFG